MISCKTLQLKDKYYKVNHMKLLAMNLIISNNCDIITNSLLLLQSIFTQ